MNTLSLEFKAQPTLEVSGLPKHFTGIAYTGAMIRNHGSLGNVVVDLDSIRIPDKLLLLEDHDRSKRIGIGYVKKDGNTLTLAGELVEDDTTLSLRRQLRMEMPIGLSIGVMGEPERPSKEVVVNGIRLKPDTVIRKAILKEISIVSFGADSDAQITAAFKSQNRERELSLLLFTQVANIHHGVHG